MTQQKWKTDPLLFNAETEQEGLQTKKKLDYDTTYRKEFLDCDPLRDWESISRCQWLWGWSLSRLEEAGCGIYAPEDFAVLDVGTKDGQFPEWLREQRIMGMGLEYSKPYVEYAVNKGRPVEYGNACDMQFDDNSFDLVFSHHLHGLLPDYMRGLQEMYRVSKRYMVALNQVPGNKKKHYSYIDSAKIYTYFIKWCLAKEENVEIIYNDFLDTGQSDEWVILLRKDETEI